MIASLRWYYPVQVVRVRIKNSISALAPLACFFILFNHTLTCFLWFVKREFEKREKKLEVYFL